MNCPFPSAGAGAASVVPVRNWADWEWPVGIALPTPLSPVIHTRFYFGACPRKSPTLFKKRHSDYSFVSLWWQPIFAVHTQFCDCFHLGQQAPAAGLPQPISSGWCLPGDSGVRPHRSYTNLSLGRSVLTVTCSGGRLQWRLEVPLCRCQPLTGFSSRTFTVFYQRVFSQGTASQVLLHLPEPGARLAQKGGSCGVHAPCPTQPIPGGLNTCLCRNGWQEGSFSPPSVPVRRRAGGAPAQPWHLPLHCLPASCRWNI